MSKFIPFRINSDDEIRVGEDHIVRHVKDRWVVFYVNWPSSDPEFKASFDEKELAIQFAYEQEVLHMYLIDIAEDGNVFSKSALAYANARAELCARLDEALEWAKERYAKRKEIAKGTDDQA